jgi:arylsulfatase A-like enzyme
MDWMPTFLAAARTRPAATYPPDGTDISAALRGGALPERTLFWRYKEHAQQACRRGPWKYLKIDSNTFLFNVEDDPLERANLKLRRPEIFAALTGAWTTWNATMLPLDPKSDSGGFDGGELADHFGVSPDD